MAEVAVTQQQIGRSGAGLVDPLSGWFTLPLADDVFEVAGNDGRCWVALKNGGAPQINAEVETVVVDDGLELPSRFIAIPANSTRLAGPFSPGTYGETLRIKTAANHAALSVQAFRLS